MDMLKELLQLDETASKYEDELAELEEIEIDAIRKNVRDGVRPQKVKHPNGEEEEVVHKWKNALELLNTAYKHANIPLPRPDQKRLWNTYEDLINFTVGEMAKSNGRKGEWRMTSPVYEGMTGTRVFMKMDGFEGEETVELHDAKSVDDAIESFINKMRRHGVKTKIDYRNDRGAVLSFYDRDPHDPEKYIKVDTVKIKQV